MEMEGIKEKGKCCVTGLPLSTSGTITIITLHKKPKWKYPVMNNVLIPGEPDRAVAIAHDNAFTKDGQLISAVKFAVEFNGDEIIYHPINSLEGIYFE